MVRGRVVNARKEKGLTQEQVARQADIDRSTYTKIENGATPSVPVAKRISDVLGLEWTIFFTQDCDESSQTDSA